MRCDNIAQYCHFELQDYQNCNESNSSFLPTNGWETRESNHCLIFDREDNERVRNMSPEARAVLDEYLERLDRGEVNDNDSCCWYDEETKSCRFYDERPSICREFERSSDACHDMRLRYGIGTAK